MSDINISAEDLKPRFDRQLELCDELDKEISRVPGPVDGGAASEYIVTILQATLEGHQNLADTHRALVAVARDVLTGFATSDHEGAEVLRGLEDAMGEG